VKEILFALLMGVAILCLQVTSYGFLIPLEYKPDVMLILVIWASQRLSFGRGICLSFLAGAAVDILSGSPIGLFALVYCLIFVASGYLHDILRVDNIAARFVLVFGASMLAGAVVLLTRRVGGPVGFGWNAAEWFLLKSVITGVSAVVVFPLIEWSWNGYSRLIGAR
jgi:rod shape-determining protein MreD